MSYFQTDCWLHITTSDLTITVNTHDLSQLTEKLTKGFTSCKIFYLKEHIYIDWCSVSITTSEIQYYSHDLWAVELYIRPPEYRLKIAPLSHKKILHSLSVGFLLYRIFHRQLFYNNGISSLVKQNVQGGCVRLIRCNQIFQNDSFDSIAETRNQMKDRLPNSFMKKIIIKK